MKPNTSNKELREQEREQTIYENKLKKQGYAKALNDVAEIVDDKIEFCNRDGSNKKNPYTIYKKIKQEIAKLAHCQQDGTRCSSMKDKDMISTSQMEKQFESVSPADTHIPKLAKEKT